MIYLACPYAHDDENIREERYREVTAMATRLMRDGLRLVYSPITHTHAMMPLGLPVEFGFWRAHARAMITACECVWVYCLPGWERSVGIREELLFAEELGRPWFYLKQVGEKSLLVDPTQRTVSCLKF